MKAWRRRKAAKGKHPTAKQSAEKKATTSEVKKTQGVQVCVAVKEQEQEKKQEVWEKERGIGLHYPK